jgi:hypothetical protein
MVANSALASGLAFGIAARTPCISQNAAVWRTRRTWGNPSVDYVFGFAGNEVLHALTRETP